MPDLWFAVPGDPETRTGGYIYAKRLAAALRARGWAVHQVPLPGGFPRPTAADLIETRRALAELPAGASVLVDGLAFGAFDRTVLAGLDLDVHALVHHPLALETGLTPDEKQAFALREREALRLCRKVIATSPHTAETLISDYDVPRTRIAVALPGTEPRPRARGSAVPSLLTVATVTPRKDHATLVAALGRLKDLAWTSTMVGSLDRAPDTAAAVRAAIAASDVADRIALAGEVSDGVLAELYSAADIFVLPSRHEGYGMVFADALSAGLPIVACAAGAVVETVPAAAATLVPAGDANALAAALRALLEDAGLRRRMADAAWDAGRRLPTWETCAHVVAGALTA